MIKKDAAPERKNLTLAGRMMKWRRVTREAVKMINAVRRVADV
jgi:hypothetical protein